MAQSFPFERPTDDDLIIVSAQLDNSLSDFVLDTGASHTFVDFGVLIKEGYRKSDTKGIVPIETANGIILANLYVVSKKQHWASLKPILKSHLICLTNPKAITKA